MLWSNPYDFTGGECLAHVDRIGFRIPDAANHPRRGPRRARPLQRSLAPHMDVCLGDIHAGGRKQFPRWRPIQTFIALTDALDQECGGFEAAAGSHLEFADREERAGGEQAAARCKGDFTAVRDTAMVDRVAHVPVPAGAAVFWDQRVVHANSRENRSKR